ncbi:hypothetical protein [Actinoplanes flavus]|uniref:Uncharacterized protein n=1 Tax=Actinoplanes flavus TaxID=2820290 RepID=A0ABS3UXW6_9ACTN|nr:hypothetical protein [Actinoplanes flavus]MBO3743427.1 hypothetical protein [Actinoplanes flavus]
MGVLKKFSTVMAFSVGLGLSVATVPAVPAVAGPAVGMGSDLEESLLTEEDLPRGYVAQDLPDADELFREVLAGYDVDQDLCSVPAAASIAEMPDQGPNAEPAKLRDQTKLREPAGVRDQAELRDPAGVRDQAELRDPAGVRDQAELREPADLREPATVREPVEVREPGKEQGESAAAVFVNEEKGLFALELLADTGPEIAADMVDDTIEVLENCPRIEQEGVELTMTPLKWNPRLGDDSAGVSMVLEVTDADFEMTLYGKLVIVAQDDLSMTVGLIGLEEPRERELKKVARAAVHKIEDMEPDGPSIEDRIAADRNL